MLWGYEREVVSVSDGERPALGSRVEAVAIHASRDIAAGEELFLFYGDAYVRDYEAGLPPVEYVTKKHIKDVQEQPASWLTLRCAGELLIDRSDLWQRVS